MKQVETEYGRQTWVLLNAGVSVTFMPQEWLIVGGKKAACLSTTQELVWVQISGIWLWGVYFRHILAQQSWVHNKAHKIQLEE